MGCATRRPITTGAHARPPRPVAWDFAESLAATDPVAARRLAAEPRATGGAALQDIRSVVRGILPPVLADRGLGGAVEALALHLATPVRVDARLTGRPPAPVESAVVPCGLSSPKTTPSSARVSPRS